MTDQQGKNGTSSPAAVQAEGNAAVQEQLKAMLLGDAATDNREMIDMLTTSLLGPTARVVLPSQDDMVLRLVSEQMIRRLDESRSTSRFLWTVVATAVGGIVGFVTNVVTSGRELDTLAWPFLGLLAIVAITASIYGTMVAIRERSVMKSILEGKE